MGIIHNIYYYISQNMRSSSLIAGLATLVASTSAFTINSPTSSDYWVQGETNTIAWSAGGSDPPVVSLQIINANRTLLNGAFAIAEYVKASLMSFTVTNVTLVVADGYVVQMVNSTNNTEVFASSGTFSVKPAGTTPAPASGSSGTQTANATSGMNGASGSNQTATSGMTSGTNGHGTTGSNNSTAGSTARNAAPSLSTPFAGLLTASLAVISFVAL